MTPQVPKYFQESESLKCAAINALQSYIDSDKDKLLLVLLTIEQIETSFETSEEANENVEHINYMVCYLKSFADSLKQE